MHFKCVDHQTPYKPFKSCTSASQSSIVTFARKMASKTFSLFLLSLALVLLCLGTAAAQGLQVGFYSKICPNVEFIVRQEMTRVISVAPSLAGPLLRMHFHDCFVGGCDGLVLLNSTQNNVAEKDAPPSQKPSRPKDHSGQFRQAGEMAARASIAQEIRQLPTANSTISSLISSFASKGLSVKDLVVLSGGHTLGTSHCTAFQKSISNYAGGGDTDPNLDSHYTPKLRAKCAPNDITTLVDMDPGSFRTFDTSYYTHVSNIRGLFESDAALLQNSQTRANVLRQAGGADASEFFFGGLHDQHG